MAKIKTSEAVDAALDWAVAICEGEDYCAHDGVDGIGNAFEATRYSTDWAQGGPILDREKIQLSTLSKGKEWRAALIYGQDHIQYGATPLIAMMRCYVASKLGPEIDVPDELLPEPANQKRPKP